MKLVSFMIVGVVMLGMSGIVSGTATVLLDEQFTGDLGNWTVLVGGGTPPTSSVAVSGGQLIISHNNPPQWSARGVESAVAYALPAGPDGLLIVDFYGTNLGGEHSMPKYLLSQYQSTGNTFQGWNNYIGVKGKDAYWGDWVQWTGVSGGSYVAITPAIGNATTLKHMILTVDAANIKVYIGTDYFENLVNPVAVYTTTTSSIFNPEWTGAVYVNLMSEENTAWYTGTSTERFDGVKVTAIPEPVTLVLFSVGGVTMLLRKKK